MTCFLFSKTEVYDNPTDVSRCAALHIPRLTELLGGDDALSHQGFT